MSNTTLVLFIDEYIIDILTKPLSKVKFEYFRDKLGVVKNESSH